MTEEIKKMIEEEAERTYLIPDDYGFIDKSDMDRFRAFKAGANFILSKWQEAERWRKVEEEPTNQDIVLVKTDKECFATAYYHGKNSGWIVYGDEAYKQFGNIVEWKPIS